MKKEQKIEIEIRPRKNETGSSIIYEVTIEDKQKYASYSFYSRQKLDGFLEGFESAVSFLNLNVQVEIRGREKLEGSK